MGLFFCLKPKGSLLWPLLPGGHVQGSRIEPHHKKRVLMEFPEPQHWLSLKAGWQSKAEVSESEIFEAQQLFGEWLGNLDHSSVFSSSSFSCPLNVTSYGFCILRGSFLCLQSCFLPVHWISRISHHTVMKTLTIPEKNCTLVSLQKTRRPKVCVFVHVCMCMCAYVNVCLCIFMCVCMHECARVCVCARMCVPVCKAQNYLLWKHFLTHLRP